MNDGLEKIIISAQGKDNGESKELLALVDLMNNKPVHLNKYFKNVQQKINDINNDPEWRDKIMDYETKMLEEKQYGKEIGLKEGLEQGKDIENTTNVKKLISALRDFNVTDSQIFQRLQKDYGDVFSTAELKKFMNQA